MRTCIPRNCWERLWAGESRGVRKFSRRLALRSDHNISDSYGGNDTAHKSAIATMPYVELPLWARGTLLPGRVSTFTTNLQGWYDPHFTDKKTEAQKGQGHIRIVAAERLGGILAQVPSFQKDCGCQGPSRSETHTPKPPFTFVNFAL